MIKLDKKYINNVIEILKQKTKIKNDREMSAALGLRNDTLAQMKARNRLPVEQIVEYCIANNISIDDVFINNKNHSSSNMKNYKILNTEDYIRLENIFNEDYSSYIDNNHNIYIIKELREYTFEGYYLINVSEQKDEIICVNIKKKLDGNYAYSYFNDRDKEYELNSIEINNLNIVAKVIKIINFSIN